MSAPRILPISPEAIAEGARLLRAGRLVAFPTETVYGLGADATNERAVASVFAAKGRPHFNPLIVHVPDLSAARRLVVFNARAEAVAAQFWVWKMSPPANPSGLRYPWQRCLVMPPTCAPRLRVVRPTPWSLNATKKCLTMSPRQSSASHADFLVATAEGRPVAGRAVKRTVGRTVSGRAAGKIFA